MHIEPTGCGYLLGAVWLPRLVYLNYVANEWMQPPSIDCSQCDGDKIEGAPPLILPRKQNGVDPHNSLAMQTRKTTFRDKLLLHSDMVSTFSLRMQDLVGKSAIFGPQGR